MNLIQQATTLVSKLPHTADWKSPFEIEHEILGKIIGTIDEDGVTWVWLTTSGSEQTIFDANRPHLGVDALKFCLDQMADRNPRLAAFCNKIKDALYTVFE